MFSQYTCCICMKLKKNSEKRHENDAANIWQTWAEKEAVS